MSSTAAVEQQVARVRIPTVDAPCANLCGTFAVQYQSLGCNATHWDFLLLLLLLQGPPQGHLHSDRLGDQRRLPACTRPLPKPYTQAGELLNPEAIQLQNPNSVPGSFKLELLSKAAAAAGSIAASPAPVSCCTLQQCVFEP